MYSDNIHYIKRRNENYLPNGFLATIEDSVSRGSDSPSALTAVTLNLYSWSGVSPVTSRPANANN